MERAGKDRVRVTSASPAGDAVTFSLLRVCRKQQSHEESITYRNTNPAKLLILWTMKSISDRHLAECIPMMMFTGAKLSLCHRTPIDMVMAQVSNLQALRQSSARRTPAAMA
jgi:hypothetical protein